MAKFGSEMACLMALVLICSCAIRAVPAAVYTVGEASGWSMGANYGSWANAKTFAVGDTLVFNYPPGHTVDEVSESDYKTCTIGNSISTDSTGATSVTLNTAGPHYFICGVPGHCTAGMKLSVTVAPTAAATLPAPGSIISPPSTDIPSLVPVTAPTGPLTRPPVMPATPSTEPPTAVGGILTRPLFSANSPSLAPLGAVTTSGHTATEISSSAILSPTHVAMLFIICIVISQSLFH